MHRSLDHVVHWDASKWRQLEPAGLPGTAKLWNQRSSCPTCGFEKPMFSTRAFLVQLPQQYTKLKLNFSPTHREKNLSLPHSLFSLIHCFVFYPCKSRDADGLWLPTLAEFCVASREAAVPETSRSSGGDWALRSLFPLLSSPYPASKNSAKCNVHKDS